MTVWRFIDSGECDADFNMALDEALSSHVRAGKSCITLRFYGWRNPAVSLGKFQSLQQVDLLYCTDNGIPVIRRPTGGRGILHIDELTYSFSASNEETFAGGLFQSYHQLGIAFESAFKSTGIDVKMNFNKRAKIMAKSPLCFKSISYGEITFNGKKIIGSAQRRWKNGFLQQGSIPFSVDYQAIKRIFRIYDDATVDNIIGIRNLVNDFNPDILKANIKRAFEDAFNITFVDSHPSPEETDLAHRLALEKYRYLR